MIKHIVIFKLPQPCTEFDKAESLKKLHEIFTPLGQKLKYIVEFRTKTVMNNSEASGDFVIDSVFATLDDLKRYSSSKEHQDAVAAASEIRKTKMVADYEF